MTQVEVTVLMVPRERYSGILHAIESLYTHTAAGTFELVVIDGALPASVREALERESQRRGFTFIHKDYPLTPNEARNLGLERANTPFVVFSDNDVLFTPNWLPPLVNTAKEFGAWLVGPTILDGDPQRGLIHAAGGDSGFEEVDGKRRYHFVPGFMQKNVADVRGQFRRGPTTMLEFHVMLARTEIFKTIGPLDEKFYSFADHDDLVISALNAGGPVIYEPGSTVSYHDPGTNIHVLEPADLPMFLLRWSDTWNDSSIEHAAKKWGLAPDDPWVPHAKRWIRTRRRRVYPIGGAFGRLVSFTLFHVSQGLGETLERSFCARYIEPLARLRARHVS